MSPWVLTYMYTLLPEASGSTSWLLLFALVGLSFSPGHNQAQSETSQELCVPSTREGLHPLPAGSRRVAPWQGKDFLLSNTQQCILVAARIPSTVVHQSGLLIPGTRFTQHSSQSHPPTDPALCLHISPKFSNWGPILGLETAFPCWPEQPGPPPH